MAERKPLGMGWQSWIDELVARAQREGEFDNLAGAGKPIEGLDEPYDEDWWLRAWLKRENLSVTPEPLELRHRIELLREELPRLRDERSVRGHVSLMNALIHRLNVLPAPDALEAIAPVEVEEALRRWRNGARAGRNG